MKWLCGLALVFPVFAVAQIPLPTLPALKPGGSTIEVLNNTSVALSGNNYFIVRTNVTGRSKGFKLLGFITIKGASSSEAMARLYAKAQIQEGRPQALANIIHERSSTYLILFSIPKAKVRADLIEFITPGELQGDELPARVRERRTETNDDE